MTILSVDSGTARLALPSEIETARRCNMEGIEASGFDMLQISPGWGKKTEVVSAIASDWDCPVCRAPQGDGITAIHHLIADHQWTATGARAWGICTNAGANRRVSAKEIDAALRLEP